MIAGYAVGAVVSVKAAGVSTAAFNLYLSYFTTSIFVPLQLITVHFVLNCSSEVKRPSWYSCPQVSHL